jgi:soluble lytic murein transglycosylase-like protein
MPGQPASPRLTVTGSSCCFAAGVAVAFVATLSSTRPAQAMQATLEQRIAHHAARNGVPVPLARAVIQQESNFNPGASNRGNYGLMQIRLQTARGIGYRGDARGLMNVETNLTWGMRYLGAAHREAGGDTCRTIQRYQTGQIARRIPAATLGYCARAKRFMTAGRW